MLSFGIVETEVRDFMNKLLREDVFDFFKVRGVDVVTFARFEISGITGVPDCTWGELRPYVFEIIKGRRPKMFKVALMLPEEQTSGLHENAASYSLNLTFDGVQVLCTAASAEKNFKMDKSVELAWHEYISQFFKEKKITVRRH